jgi:uncharacterized protein
LLQHTFIHIPGIGGRSERNLWDQGIRTWNDFISQEKTVFSPYRDARIREELEDSLSHQQDIGFFADRLPPAEQWRVFESFREEAAYLDIETSGDYSGMEEITVIGLYDGRRVQTFVQGINLEAFEETIASCKLMVTFNGSCFDLPHIRRWFRHIDLPRAHIDLRFTLKKIGLQGGLKAIEKQTGLVRGSDIEGLSGFDAVLLWQAYQRGNSAALDRLIAYNTMDVVHLQALMELAARELKKRLFPF